MPEKDKDPFIESEDHWLSITREESEPRGAGKWMLHTEQPHRLYRILRDALRKGKLPSALSIKTKAKTPSRQGAVYIYTGPYTDRDRVLGLAEELRTLNDAHDLKLNRPLIYKTDLHNTWCETLARPGDGYHELLKRNWLYRYKDGKLVVNAAIHALHRAMENPPENADREFLIIRSLLPDHLFATPRGNKEE